MQFVQRRQDATVGSTAVTPQDRKEQIVDAARVLFVRHGYRRNSMSDIAEQAGIAKRTLYLHFQSKDAIFRAVLDGCQEVVRARARAAVDDTAAPLAERLADLLYAYMGTALEWFGDPTRLDELGHLVLADPELFGDRIACERLMARAAELLQRAVGGRPSKATIGSCKARAEVAVLATVGASRFHDATPENLRSRVELIARCACDGLGAQVDT
jgi:AcrR family transcriptional regulator